MVDEMDLLSGLKTAEPVRPRAYEDARAVLRAAMAVEGVTETAPRARRRWGGRRTAGFGAALGAAAAAVAAVLVVTSAPAPSHHLAAVGSASAGTRPAAKAPATANPVLTQLAADITVRPATLPGDATLEIRNTSPTSDAVGDNGIDVYTDDGTYYWGYDKADLLQVIAQRQDTGQGEFKRDIAAALIAASGDVTTARAHMAVANFIPGTHPDGKQAAIEKLKAVDKAKGIRYTPPKPLTPEQKKEQTDNLIWMNSTDALTAAPEIGRAHV